MSVVLLPLSTRRRTPEVIAAGIRAAQEAELPLHVAYVLDVRAANQLQKRVGEAGFVGERPCEELAATIHGEQEVCARAVLDDVAAQAAAAGCTVATSITTGPFVDAVLRLIVELQAAHAVVARRPISKFRRFIEGSSADVIERTAPCPVTIVDSSPGLHS